MNFQDSLRAPTRSGLIMADFLGPARLLPSEIRRNNESRLLRRRFSPPSVSSQNGSSSEDCQHPVTYTTNSNCTSSSSLGEPQTTAVDNDNCYPSGSRSKNSTSSSDHTWYSSRTKATSTSSSYSSLSSSPLVWISLVLALICSLSQVAAIPSHQVRAQN